MVELYSVYSRVRMNSPGLSSILLTQEKGIILPGWVLYMGGGGEMT